MPRGSIEPIPLKISPEWSELMRRVVDEHVEEFARHTRGEFVPAYGRREGKTATESAIEREQAGIREWIINTAILDFGGFRTEIDLKRYHGNPYSLKPGDRIRLPLYVKEPARYMAGEHPGEDRRQIVLTFQHVGPTTIGSRRHPLFILEAIGETGEESKSSDSKVLKLKPGAKRKLSL